MVTTKKQINALLSIAKDLRQIANNFEEEAKRENDRFRRGMGPEKDKWWIENHLVNDRIATIFDCPFPLHQPNGLPHNKREFSLIVDSLQVYMPSMVNSLAQTYNHFLNDIKFHLNGAIRADKKGNGLLFWCHNFVNTTIPATVRRLRHIAEMVELKAKAANGCGDTKRKPSITKEEANVRARPILKKNPRITARDLSAKIGCALGQIPELPVWQAVHEQLKKGRKPQEIRLSGKMLTVTGKGEKNEVLNTLIAEQDKEQKADDRRAKIYLNQRRKK